MGDSAIKLLTGGARVDKLEGAAGNDYPLGEASNDAHIGDAGADVFVFDNCFGHDTISDIWASTGRTDRMWVINTDIHSFANVQTHAADTATGLVLTISLEDSITFTGLMLSSFVADDFIFV